MRSEMPASVTTGLPTDVRSTVAASQIVATDDVPELLLSR
jgi:hypothetical protein